MEFRFNIYVVVVVIILFVGGVVTAFLLTNPQVDRYFEEKNESLFKEAIIGVLDHADLISHHEYFMLEGGEDYYYIWDLVPYDYLPNDGGFGIHKDIRSYAKKGDSIIKEANTNFFTLKKKNGETFRYYFYVYNE